MGRKAKGVAAFCVVLLLGLAFGFYASLTDFVDVALGSALPWWPSFIDLNVTGNETVTWDFYVVAGVNTSSPAFVPAQQPTNFSFTVASGGFSSGGTADGPGPVTGGFDFGNVAWRPVEFEGCSLELIAEYGWVRVNITNLLGADMVITNITAEVTNGTETLDYPPPWSQIPEDPFWFGNHTLVAFDALDLYVDECDYNTGVAGVSEVDSNPWLGWTDAYPSNFTGPTWVETGPLTLVGPDRGGDAAATGHVAPILLRNEETFTEYFGVELFGNATSNTKIYGTITLTLTYKRISSSDVDVLQVSLDKTEAYNTWTVDVNVTVKNWDSVPMDINVSLWGPVGCWGNITHWSGGTWEKIGPTQLVNLANMTETTLTWTWDLANAPEPWAEPLNVPVRAIAVSQGSFYFDELWNSIDLILWGDINNNTILDLGDIGKMLLIYSGIITEPQWMVDRRDMNGNGVMDLGDIGKVILCYSSRL